MRQVAGLSQRLAGSAFFKNALALVSGTVVTQVIVFLFSPLLTRVYGPEAFGTFANYSAWVAVLALLSSLRYEHAIFVAADTPRTDGVVALTTVLSLASFALYSAVALALAVSPVATPFLRNLHGFVLYIPLGVLVACVSSLFIQLNVKQGNFKRLAVVGTAQMLGTVIPQLLVARARASDGLIIGSIVGTVISAVALAALSYDRARIAGLRAALAPARLRDTAVEYRNFPRYALGADTVSIVSQQFVPVFVLALFNPVLAGLYAFAIRIVRVPLIVISTAVAGALRKEAVDRLRSQLSLRPLFRTTVRTLVLVAIVPFLVMVLFSPQIFAVVFGSAWTDAGHLVQILSPGILFEFVAFPLSVMFLVTNTQRYALRVQAAGFVCVVAALVAGRHLLNDFIATCYLISGAMVLVNGWSIALASRVVREHGAALVPAAAGGVSGSAPELGSR